MKKLFLVLILFVLAACQSNELEGVDTQVHLRSDVLSASGNEILSASYGEYKEGIIFEYQGAFFYHELEPAKVDQLMILDSAKDKIISISFTSNKDSLVEFKKGTKDEKAIAIGFLEGLDIKIVESETTE